jgi:hypothetical protein
VSGPGAGPARGYRWADAEAGNELALVHGAYSERRLAPRAAQIAGELLSHPDTPEWLRTPSYAPAVAAWSRAEAVVSLLWDYLAEVDLQQALADVTELDEQHAKGSTRSTARRTEAVLTQLHRHETRAANLRRELGLSPLSRARLGRDIGVKFDAAKLFAEISEGEDE